MIHTPIPALCRIQWKTSRRQRLRCSASRTCSGTSATSTRFAAGTTGCGFSTRSRRRRCCNSASTIPIRTRIPSLPPAGTAKNRNASWKRGSRRARPRSCASARRTPPPQRSYRKSCRRRRPSSGGRCATGWRSSARRRARVSQRPRATLMPT